MFQWSLLARFGLNRRKSGWVGTNWRE